ncbi:flavin reductase family protein [Vagococcus fluvialis]|uniref:flavin reductase family protein n=1 Tax=Vagococcus fluvialis TaxID=2738 RepID=UPI001D09D0D2|nr:flavin reductase family protein [Vagococcus fluvialis]MDT2745898.1 flavin reductase family protein [Vagococcus fluvialis]UDM74354.1 flavin reductase family protein [Vagococcus fluvialis]
MASIRPEDMAERDNYKFLIGSIIPRPIAVVTSLSERGILNIAPFSYFNIVTSNPPIVSISIQRKSGEMKDTVRNILALKEAVIHIADEENIEDINQTAANLLATESELPKTTFTTKASDIVKVPQINEIKIKMEVSLYEHVEIKNKTQVSADLLLLKIEKYHIPDEIYHEGRIDPDGLKPMSRLAGHDYAALGTRRTIVRPD